ncbi:MAG: helix-turn-helix transcriptional regulator [Pirellulales bacterium]
MKVSDQLRAAIDSSGLSHNELSRVTGVSQPAISRFVNGERGLNSESIDRLAAHLGLVLTIKRKRRSN